MALAIRGKRSPKLDRRTLRASRRAMMRKRDQLVSLGPLICHRGSDNGLVRCRDISLQYADGTGSKMILMVRTCRMLRRHFLRECLKSSVRHAVLVVAGRAG